MAILSDPELLKRIKSTIEKDKLNAEYALTKVTDSYIKIFDSMTDNEYIRQRSSDIHDVTKRVLSHLLGVPLVDPALIHQPVIIIAHDLTPSDTAQFVPTYVKGIVSDMGGRTSHSAIMSRSLEIPAVVGFTGSLSEIKNGETVIVDGSTGNVIVNPTEAQKKNLLKNRLLTKTSESLSQSAFSDDQLFRREASNFGCQHRYFGRSSRGR